jgi:hypothetical protein
MKIDSGCLGLEKNGAADGGMLASAQWLAGVELSRKFKGLRTGNASGLLLR